MGTARRLLDRLAFGGRRRRPPLIVQDDGPGGQLEDAFSAQAQRDPLTGLFTRRRFEAELARELAYVQRYRVDAAVVTLEIDHSKPVHDALDHDAGDSVLRTVGTLMRTHLRGSDVAARLGGGEFAILLSGTDEEGATVVAGKLVSLVRDSFPSGQGHGPPTTASLGIAMLDPASDGSTGGCLARAADAMDEARRAGGDGFVLGTGVRRG